MADGIAQRRDGPAAVGSLPAPQAAGGHPWLPEARRLFVGSAGPVAVAATQFAASMLLWSHAPAKAFGLFAFALLLIQFSLGLSNALVCTPLAVAPHDSRRERHIRACLTAHGSYLAAIALVLPAILWLTGAGWSLVPLTLLALATNLRWAARGLAIASEDVGTSARSDASFALATALLLLAAGLAGSLTIEKVSICMLLANVVALAASSRAFLRMQLEALFRSELRYYIRKIWRHQSRWAIVGVVSTEASSNAHAYLVTWLAGAATFAPLAFGSLFCRPLTIFLTAITQIDRPIFARLLSQNAWDRVRHLLGMNFVAVTAIWIGNAAVAVGVLWLFEDRIAARGYAICDLRTIVAVWLAIMAFRAVRNPLSTFIQARRDFRPLAYCSVASSVISIAAVLAFIPFGAAFSLLGVLCGEAVLLALIALLAWKHLVRCSVANSR